MRKSMKPEADSLKRSIELTLLAGLSKKKRLIFNEILLLTYIYRNKRIVREEREQFYNNTLDN